MTHIFCDQPLPIDAVLPELKQQLQNHNNVLLSAAPGAGKTTRVPLALMDEHWLAGRKILMLEPRRIATRNAAQFMAAQLHEHTGQRVGYRMRLESSVSTQTHIEVVTEGLLTRMLQDDPELSEVGLVIFDEFHERNLHSDLGLALTHNCQQLFREDLKILVMSATLDEALLAKKLNAAVVKSKGRSFAVQCYYRPPSQPLINQRRELVNHCVRVIQEALQHPGDMLVFLPGVAEINALQQALDLPEVLITPLHGQLSDPQQKLALAPLQQHNNGNKAQRKVILATNIAESSVTIDGVRIVIDSGLERQQVFQVRSGIERLVTRHISQASATQRQGRAGRQAAGVCYRLWAESQHNSRAQHIHAQISQCDLTTFALELLRWGATADELLWLTPPDAAALKRAHQLLQQLNILTPSGQLSAHGQQLSPLGLDPRWAHSLLYAAQQGYGRAAAQLIALLQQRPPQSRHSDDVQHWLQQAPTSLKKQAQRLAQPWIQCLQMGQDRAELNTALCIAMAFPDRIAQQRQAGTSQYQLSSGTGVELTPDSILSGSPWLAVAELGGKYSNIRLASALSQQDMQTLLQHQPHLRQQRVVIDWQENGQLLAQQQECIGHLLWHKTNLAQLNQQQWQQAWLNYFQRHGLNDLPWDEPCQTLQQRLSLLHTQQPDGGWPDLSQQALEASVEHWLMPFLNNARHRRDLKKIDLYSALLSQLSWPQQQTLKQLAPTHIDVASGSRIRIDYSQRPPVLAVKLQEMFGFDGQPAIINGHLPLMIHLLSPAQRPLAVTQDLRSFWQNSYPEVRKDMRGRYPKHPWPENPLTAQPTRLTKRRAADKN